jgi:molybdopterin-guanine dinucleotide biosynthesis protein A
LLAEELEAWLTVQSDRSIRAWMRQAGANMVRLPERLFNINTPEALAEAEVRLFRDQS